MNLLIGICMVTSVFLISTSTCQTNTTTIAPTKNPENHIGLTKNETNNESAQDETVGDMFKNASKEVIQLSLLAWIIILVPLTTTLIFVVLIFYLCCKRFNKQKGHCRYDSDNFIRAKVKAPVGQPAPIPLTGLVNQPYGQGLKLLPKFNHPMNSSTPGRN